MAKAETNFTAEWPPAHLPSRSERWGETQQYVMRHMLLGGKLPRFIGFDKGPD